MTTVGKRCATPKGARYQCTKNQCYKEEIGRYVSFGIEASDANGVLLGRLEDVCPDQGWVEALVKRLNDGQAAPEHLIDIVINALGQ